jgi:hypothetical protein
LASFASAQAIETSEMRPVHAENGDLAILSTSELGTGSPPRQLALQTTNDADRLSVTESAREAPVQPRTDHIADEDDLDCQ